MCDGKRERERKREERRRGFPPPPFACTCGEKRKKLLSLTHADMHGERRKRKLSVIRIDVGGERRKKKRERRERDSDRGREPLLMTELFSVARDRETRRKRERGKRGGKGRRNEERIAAPRASRLDGNCEGKMFVMRERRRARERERERLSLLSSFFFSTFFFLISLLYLYIKKILQ